MQILMKILIKSSTQKQEETIIYQQFRAKIEEEEEVGVQRRLQNECGFEEKIKLFLVKLGLDRTSRKQPECYNHSGPQVDQVLKVSLHRNLTVNTIVFAVLYP